jgi:DNA-binding NarL/FixJ family response regulator
LGEAADGQIAVEMARRLAPEVIIMDLSMPRMNGIEATQRIKEELPCVRVIGLSMYEQADRADALLKAGAVAYLNKAGPSDELIAAIRRSEPGCR